MAMMIKTKKEMMIDSKEKTDCNYDSSNQPILVMDLLISILERLSFADFRRAICISSDWHFASKSCIRGTNPWLIFFPKVHNEIENDSCKLFDPRDKCSYTIRDLGFDLARSGCYASHGSWFLMFDGEILHLLNIFTRERIPFPSLESINDVNIIAIRMEEKVFYAALDYKAKDSRKLWYVMVAIGIRKAVLWVDEKSRDYLVVWSSGRFLAYQKRGDNNSQSWKIFEPLKNECCVDMVLKESKLFILGRNGAVTVFDFSCGDSPIECASFPSLDRRLWSSLKNIAVTSSGEILIVLEMAKYKYKVYKMDTKSSEWRIIETIGDETWLLDLGITVAAQGGVVRNCIYSSRIKPYYSNMINDYTYEDNGICVYNIKSNKVFQVFKHLDDSSSILFEDGRWFFPIFS